jgi:hypothetical protein
MLLNFVVSVVMFVCKAFYVYVGFVYLISSTPNSNFHSVKMFLTAHFEMVRLLPNMSTYKLRISVYN